MDVLVGFWDGVKEASELGEEDIDGTKEGDELDSFVGLAVGGADDSEGAPDSEGDMLGSNDGLSDKEGFIEGSKLGSLDLDGDKLGTEDGSADTEGDELDSFVGLAVGGYVAAIGDNVGGGLGGAAIGDNVGGRLGGDGLGAGAATE